VFVLTAEKYGEDQFFVLKWSKVQDIPIANHKRWLDSHGGVRPRKPDSLHCAIVAQDLKKYKDNWSMISSRFQPAPVGASLDGGNASHAHELALIRKR